jgi:YD repeat-containing protein
MGGDTVSFLYDALDRVTSETGALGQVAYQYDAAGNNTRVTHPDGFYAQYDYNAGSELAQGVFRSSGHRLIAENAQLLSLEHTCAPERARYARGERKRGGDARELCLRFNRPPRHASFPGETKRTHDLRKLARRRGTCAGTRCNGVATNYGSDGASRLNSLAHHQFANPANDDARTFERNPARARPRANPEAAPRRAGGPSLFRLRRKGSQITPD